MRTVLIGVLAVLLSACGVPDVQFQIPVQKWEDTVIEVQTRPAPVRPGVNEFLIIATLERGKPVHHYVVSLRANESQPWSQAIQDGHSGVYRKAINVPAESPYLYIKLRKKRSDEQVVLKFDLRPADMAKKG